MGIPTKEIKRLVANPRMDYPDHKHGRGRRICAYGIHASSGHRYACVYVRDTDGTKLVITVVWEHDFVRGAKPT